MPGPTICWFRRDLRLADHPAARRALEAGGDEGAVALYVLDPALLGPAGAPRTAYLLASLADLDESLEGRLVVRTGDPVEVVPAVANELDAAAVYVSADFAPHGRARDERVAAALRRDHRKLVAKGSPYAVEPGTVRKGDGTPFKVFTPFSRAWAEAGWEAPAPRVASRARWVEGVRTERLPDPPDLGSLRLPEVGESAAHARLRSFLDDGVSRYADRRDLPGVEGTSRLSPDLRWGAIHPRTILAELGSRKGESTFRKEVCWREFYADVLFHRPDTAREAFLPQMAAMEVDDGADAEALFDTWKQGRTGYPVVDAGMRQLLAEGWVHNRVRMLVASFLVKDLHLPWWWGARWFMERLVDGDLASNQHGWQWGAGTGTDAAPYFRVFNPTTQGMRFDPDGTYVERWVPELRGLGKGAHEPWKARAAGADTRGYPDPVVDHAEERDEALRRYDRARGR